MLQENDAVMLYLSNDAAAAYTDGMFHFYVPVTSAFAMSGTKLYYGDYIKEQINVRIYSASAASPITIYYTDTIDYGF